MPADTDAMAWRSDAEAALGRTVDAAVEGMLARSDDGRVSSTEVCQLIVKQIAELPPEAGLAALVAAVKCAIEARMSDLAINAGLIIDYGPRGVVLQRGEVER